MLGSGFQDEVRRVAAEREYEPLAKCSLNVVAFQHEFEEALQKELQRRRVVRERRQREVQQLIAECDVLRLRQQHNEQR